MTDTLLLCHQATSVSVWCSHSLYRSTNKYCTQLTAIILHMF